MQITDVLPTTEAELYRRIDEVAFYVWDPIGICELPTARDEYSDYHLGLYGRAKAKDREGLIEYMKWVETDRMGLSFDAVKADRAAKLILAWVEQIEQ